MSLEQKNDWEKKIDIKSKLGYNKTGKTAFILSFLRYREEQGL